MPIGWMLFAIRMTVCVQGQEIAPPGAWTKAQTLSEHILERAGIEAIWQQGVECLPPAVCIQVSRILPPRVHPDTVGYTIFPNDGGGSYAAIYLPAVMETAHGLEVDPGTVLGAALTHEIGHLLLGSRAHSSGIMTARFDSAQMRAASRGELLFRPGEAQRLRSAAAGRSATATGCLSFP